MFLAFFAGLAVAVLYSLDLSSSDAINSDKESFEYVLVGKIQDRDNLSTAMRASTVINDMKIFYDYPFTGIGDGNQGYFYRQNVPMWVVASEEVQSLMHGTKIANGGGNFFPSFVSAYGLIGVVFFYFFKVISESFPLLNPDKKHESADDIYFGNVVVPFNKLVCYWCKIG